MEQERDKDTIELETGVRTWLQGEVEKYIGHLCQEILILRQDILATLGRIEANQKKS